MGWCWTRKVPLEMKGKVNEMLDDRFIRLILALYVKTCALLLSCVAKCCCAASIRVIAARLMRRRRWCTRMLRKSQESLVCCNRQRTPLFLEMVIHCCLLSVLIHFHKYNNWSKIFAYSESKLTFHFVVLVVVLVRRKVEKDGNAKKGPLY